LILNHALTVSSVKDTHWADKEQIIVTLEAEVPDGDPHARIIVHTARGHVELGAATLAEGQEVKPGQVYQLTLTLVDPPTPKPASPAEPEPPTAPTLETASVPAAA
jgi:hypothetical protein